MIDYLKKQLDSISELEEELSNIKSNNRKRKCLLELNKSLLYLKRIVPYLVITGITTGCISMVSIPFYRDKCHKNLWQKREIDSNGNKVVEEQYEEYKENSEISFVSKWEKYNDEYYVRDITVYQIKSLTNEEIERLVLEQDISLKEILGNPIMTKTEKKNNLSEEELNADGFIRAIIYNKNEETYKIVHETNRDNNLWTALWLIALMISNGMYSISTFNLRSKDKMIERYNQLVDEFEALDEDELRKRLAIRKETLERLNR